MKTLPGFLLTYLEILSVILVIFGLGQLSMTITMWQAGLMRDWSQIGIYGGSTLLVGGIIAFLWHRKDPQRTSAVHLWLQGIIAFYLVYYITGYAFAKILKTQFQAPNFVLETPIGDLSGFWLTWTYFGYSQTFAYIIGYTQIAGCLLLLFRKTRLLGTIILIPVMLNICLVDHFYEVSPLAYFNALHYTFMLTFFLVLDADKLIIAVFSFKNKLKANDWRYWMLNLARVLVIGFAFLKIYSLHESFQAKTKLNGVWKVEKINLKGHELIPEQHPDSAWSKIYFEWRYGCLFKVNPYHFNDRKDQFGQYKVNEATSELKINMEPADPKQTKGDSLMLHYYFITDSSLVLSGVKQKDSLRLELKRLK